ncbi:MAG: type II toxin-antitoxin system VapC family toxin [Anaerolineae bacterium]|nr:type II toxin-antitoxin system VapC family toxin [Anaerolineae bacterium]
MTNLVCVDASLTLKLVLAETDSDLALTLWEEWGNQQVTVIAPFLWGYEVTSVIRNQVYRGKFSVDLGLEAFSAIQQLPIQLMQPDGLFRRAWELAHRLNRPAAYDAHYLALAEMTGCPFWTSDERLFNAVHEKLSWVNYL